MAVAVVQESVREAVDKSPDHFVVAVQHGTAATEEMLDAVLAHYASPPAMLAHKAAVSELAAV
jgi:hypothetical protein